MPVTAKKTEKTQLYLRSGQLDRLHKLKGAKRGTTISGLVVEAIDLFLAEYDGKHGKKRSKPSHPVSAA